LASRQNALMAFWSFLLCCDFQALAGMTGFLDCINDCVKFVFILQLHDFLGSKGFSQAKPSTKMFVLGSIIASIRVCHRYHTR
jgi:hypothetical protein